MDDPDLSEELHRNALSGLERINKYSRTWVAAWKKIRQVAQAGDGPISVLDVACGSGGFLLNVAKAAEREKLSIELIGLDISPTAIQISNERAQEKGLNVQFLQGSATEIDSGSQYDVVCCSLFLHHLRISDVAKLLEKMKSTAEQLLVIQDLRRTLAGYLLALIVPKLLSRSKIVHVDAVRSVLSAFTIDEIRTVVRDSGLGNAKIDKLWPQRFLLTWQRSSNGHPL